MEYKSKKKICNDGVVLGAWKTKELYWGEQGAISMDKDRMNEKQINKSEIEYEYGEMQRNSTPKMFKIKLENIYWVHIYNKW